MPNVASTKITIPTTSIVRSHARNLCLLSSAVIKSLHISTPEQATAKLPCRRK